MSCCFKWFFLKSNEGIMSKIAIKKESWQINLDKSKKKLRQVNLDGRSMRLACVWFVSYFVAPGVLSCVCPRGVIIGCYQDEVIN